MKLRLVLLLLFTTHLCPAQWETVVVPGLHANVLSGVVLYPDDGPIPKAEVSIIECGNGEFRGISQPVILQKVETDANGNFAFPWKGHTRACLQVRSPNMDPLQVEVRYAKSGGKLKLRMVIAT